MWVCTELIEETWPGFESWKKIHKFDGVMT